jgi:hypothetical protein
MWPQGHIGPEECGRAEKLPNVIAAGETIRELAIDYEATIWRALRA